MGLVHTEIAAAVLNELVELFETALVEQQFQSFSGCEFAFGVLSVDSCLTSAQLGLGPALNQLFDFFLLDTHIVFALGG